MNPRVRRTRLNDIQQIAESLRQSDDVPAPDLTGSILDAVDAQRPFLSSRTRRLVIAGRFALGFAVVAVVGTIALTSRWAPAMFEFVQRPAPLSTVVDSVQSEAQVRLADLQRQVQTVTISTGSTAPSAPVQVIYSLVSPSETAGRAHAIRCTMVGPTQPASEAAQRCCGSDQVDPACCAYRPLAGIAGLRGVPVPFQSSWRVQDRPGTGLQIEELDPLSLDPSNMPR
ncbi:MAG: hypothetical protein IT438_00955 [Phycisphaerales bacterium]|nr:hypothetical protein [Phycisphaerales bacterium]